MNHVDLAGEGLERARDENIVERKSSPMADRSVRDPQSSPRKGRRDRDCRRELPVDDRGIDGYLYARF